MDSSGVKALIFDVFGTVVDWRTSITRQGQEFGKANGLKADWEAFADSWRSKYRPYMDKVRSGESLSLLAQRYNVKVSSIKAANNLNSDMVRIGQVLTIPST